MKRLPRSLPPPTKHIVDWFHIAKKIQPLQQVVNHIVRRRDEWTNETVILDEEIRALKWKLWHGQVNRAIHQLEKSSPTCRCCANKATWYAGRIWRNLF